MLYNISMVQVLKKLSLIAPEECGSKEYFGYHREAVYDVVFGGGVAVKEMFDVLNDPNLTLEQAKAFYQATYAGNDKMLLDGRDIFILNRYINEYVQVPLFYDDKAPNPVNNRVGDYLVDFLVDVKGWAKVQDRIYTADPESYRRFFDLACKGYYINLSNHALKYDFLASKFVAIDNSKREYLYYDDKQLCDEMASKLASARVEIFREAVLSDTERKVRLREFETKEEEKLVSLDEEVKMTGKFSVDTPTQSNADVPKKGDNQQGPILEQ